MRWLWLVATRRAELCAAMEWPVADRQRSAPALVAVFMGELGQLGGSCGGWRAEGEPMRHLIGILLAVVMAGVLYFATAWGYLRLTTLTSPLSRMPAGGGSLLSDHRMLAGLIAVGGTGLLAGILVAAPRISPLAAGLPGLLLLGLTALYLVNVRHAVHLIPLKSHPYGAGFEAMLVHGILGAAGLAMIVPMFVPSRWRARRQPEPESELIGDAGYIPGSSGITEPLLPGYRASYPEQGAQAGPAGPLPGVPHQALPGRLPRRLLT